MKELSIEQKAHRYDEALKAVVVAHKDEDRHLKATLERIFPELKELDDEMIRKAIRYAIGQSTHSDGTLINGVSSEEALAWLKRQGEHNHAWSEEDEKNLNDAILFIETGTYSLDKDNLINWLKSLKDCVQSKVEWSEADKNRFNNLIFLVECSNENEPTKKGFINFINRLKSLRHQNAWRPSLAQINALSIVSKGSAPDDIEAIVSLYNDLKKLREE